MRQICQICFKDDCHCFKSFLQQEDGRHVAYGKHAMLCSFQDKNDGVSLQLKTGASTSSSPHGEKKDEHAKKHKRCGMRKKAYSEQMKQRLPSRKVHKICTSFQKKGHVVSHCWTLHPTCPPTHMQQDDKKIGKGGTTDSIIDVDREVLHEENLQ